MRMVSTIDVDGVADGRRQTGHSSGRQSNDHDAWNHGCVRQYHRTNTDSVQSIDQTLGIIADGFESPVLGVMCDFSFLDIVQDGSDHVYLVIVVI